jgi:hypothetical protein
MTPILYLLFLFLLLGKKRYYIPKKALGASHENSFLVLFPETSEEKTIDTMRHGVIFASNRFEGIANLLPSAKEQGKTPVKSSR